MTLQEIKKYLLENKICSKVRICKNRRYGHTLWGYKYPDSYGNYRNFADVIYNIDDVEDKDLEYIKKDVELVMGIIN